MAVFAEACRQRDSHVLLRLTSGADGHVSGMIDYDVFGEPVAETGIFSGSAGGSGGISALVFAYAGKPYDSVTGLSDYGFRNYAPTLACEFCEAKSREEKRSFSTFTTVDPIRDGSNWYDTWSASFAKQNLVEKNEVFRPDPVNYVDLWGLWSNNGDGTFVAQKGDTLFGLQEETGKPWNSYDYQGDPKSVQTGQIVSIVKVSEPNNHPSIDST